MPEARPAAPGARVPATVPAGPRALVIGYGSDLRRDDAAGRRAAEAVAALRLPDVEVRSVHQLTPELAALLPGREVVVFVDASIGGGGVQVRALSAGHDPSVSTHHVDAAALLALTTTLGGAPPPAWMVSIPAGDLGLGMELSPATAAAVDVAVERIVELLGPRRPIHGR